MSDPDEFYLMAEPPDVPEGKVNYPLPKRGDTSRAADPKTPTNDQQGQAQRRSETDRR